jgi:trafficking protein particle complex subunit 6
MSNFDQPLPPFNASDPSATFLNSSCLDLLLIEIVPMAYRLVNELDAADALATADRSAGSAGGTTTTTTTTGGGGNHNASHSQDGAASSVAGTASATGTAATGTRKLDDEEERDAVFYRLETLGYRVGLGLVER